MMMMKGLFVCFVLFVGVFGWDSDETIKNYGDLKNCLMEEGCLSTYQLRSSEHNLMQEGPFTFMELFLPDSPESEHMGSEYIFFYSRKTEYLDWDKKTFGLEEGNTRVEIYTQIRLFQQLPTNFPSITAPVEITQYTTVLSDTTGKYEPFERLSSFSLLYNWTISPPPKNGDNYLVFYRNNPKPVKEIMNMNDLDYALYDWNCDVVCVVWFGPPTNETYIGGSYRLLTNSQKTTSTPHGKLAINFGDDGNNYLWYGPSLQVNDYRSTYVYYEKQKGEGEYFDGEMVVRTVVSGVQEGDSNNVVGDVLGNNLFYLTWGKNLFFWEYCY